MNPSPTKPSDRRPPGTRGRTARPTPTEIDGRLLLGSARRVRIHYHGRNYDLVETGDGRLELSA